MRKYITLALGGIIFIVGVLSIIKPNIFITKHTPKVHPYFYIDSKKYIQIRGGIYALSGVILIIIYLTGP